MATDFKDWPAMAANLIPAIKELHKGSPGVMKAFREMGAAAHEGGALDAKHGATREEIAETMGLAVYMGAGPSAMYAAQALEAYDQFTEKAAG